MESETTSLILNTYDISQSLSTGFHYNATINNRIGTITENRCNLTWKSINMEQVLGEMYDKYETFNIHLYQINQSQAFGAAPLGSQYAMVDVRMSGLPFVNNGYNVVSRNNISSAYVTSYILNIAPSHYSGTTTNMFNPIILTFGKSTNIVDINITIKNTLDQKYPPFGNGRTLGQLLFHFKINGIPTRENIITNGLRLFQ
jgi:hypothetical protein